MLPAGTNTENSLLRKMIQLEIGPEMLDNCHNISRGLISEVLRSTFYSVSSGSKKREETFE